MNNLKLQLHFSKNTRNIYEEAELYQQNRHNISDKLDILVSPKDKITSLMLKDDKIATEDDAEAAMLEHGGDDIDGNAILDIIEKNCNAKGLSLKDNWRELTLRNLELWANQG